MPSPPTPPSPRSSRSCPPIAIEARGSPRLAVAWASWCLWLAGAGLAAALRGWAATGAWPWLAAIGLACLPLALAWPGCRWLAGRGPRAARRLRREADGRWWLELRGGWQGYVAFGPARRLGPLVWLHGRGPHGALDVLLDGGTMEPNAFRALKARVGHPAPARGEGPRKGD